MNRYVLNNKNINPGDKIVIDCKYNPDNVFEFTMNSRFEPDYKNKIYVVDDISNDDFGEMIKLKDVSSRYLNYLFRHSVSKVNDQKPVNIPEINRNYIIGKDISHMPYLTNIHELNNFSYEDYYHRINELHKYDEIFDLTFKVIDIINDRYYLIKSLDNEFNFIAPSWILYDVKPIYEPKGKIIRTFENFKNYYE